MYLKKQEKEKRIIALEKELTEIGFIPLRTREEVKNYLGNRHGLVLLFLNTVCSCVGDKARLGVRMALSTGSYQPDYLLTVFDKVDEEALEQVSEHYKPYVVSFPTISLFRDGSLLFSMERLQLKEKSPEEIAKNLQEGIERHACR